MIKPYRQDDTELPGWWVVHHPDQTLPMPGGHANLGMAHGAAGVLALATTRMRGRRPVRGDRHPDQLVRPMATGLTRRTVVAAVDHPGGAARWPSRTTGSQPTILVLRNGRHRRAQQLAAIAAGDPQRQHAAEDAIAACLTDPQLDRIAEPGLCHGIAGIYQSADRAARDAHNPAIA